MAERIDAVLKVLELNTAEPEQLRFVFAHACVERVRYLLEDENVIRCLDMLAAYVQDQVDRSALDEAAKEAAELANQHSGSKSLDGVGHAAVSASYAVARALAGKAIQAAEYAAYAAVYGSGGYGATSDPASFEPERAWQLVQLHRVAVEL